MDMDHRPRVLLELLDDNGSRSTCYSNTDTGGAVLTVVLFDSWCVELLAAFILRQDGDLTQVAPTGSCFARS